MNDLITKISRRIDEKNSCTIFEGDVSTYWPCDLSERKRQRLAIMAFAEQHGWRAAISDPGIRVTFRKII